MDPPIGNRKAGRVKFNGHYESWYSDKVFPGKNLKIPGRHVDKRGLIMDKDGYICVATNLVEMGKKINTSYGMGKRYDTSTIANTVEIYTHW